MVVNDKQNLSPAFNPDATGRSAAIAVALLLIFYLLVVLRNAWVGDDSFITFRVVDNFFHGYGLVWNINERVQPYTHPLWMLLVSSVYFFTRELFFSVIILSTVLSAIAAYIVVKRIANGFSGGVVALAAFVFSRSFIDYSTSGLENPLTHLLLALLCLVLLRTEKPPLRKLLLVSLLTGLAMTTRMDLILFFLPALVYLFWKVRSKRAVQVLLIGLSPFILWKAFALFYYGFPFPNTAYAKLGSGVSRTGLFEQGLYYFLSALKYDPLTLLIIVAGLVLPFFIRMRAVTLLALGVLLNLIYIIVIGGGFMVGRLFTPAFFVGAALVAFAFRDSDLKSAWVPLGIVVLLGMVIPYPTVGDDPNFGRYKQSTFFENGIADARAEYFNGASLINVQKGVSYPDPSNVKQEALKMYRTKSVITLTAVGFPAYFTGPQTYIIDRCALADPLLARLPIPDKDNWRIGHFIRTVPDGYFASVAADTNAIFDSSLAKYYDKIRLITRGPLFSIKRLWAIAAFNLGLYDSYLEEFIARKYGDKER